MTHSHRFRPAARRLFCAILATLSLTLGAYGAEAPRKSFDVPAGDAIATLKQAAQQAGMEIMFPAATVQGVKTAAVKGEFTPREALDQMLKDTGLVAVQDEKTGALAVKKDPLPNAERVAQAAATRTSQSKIEDGVLKLDTFEVTGLRITGIVNQGVIPREENQAVRFEVISRTDIDRSGLTDVAELFRQLPFQQGNGTGSQVSAANFGASVGTGFINTNGDTLNLRGLGADATAVLINGRRLLTNDRAGTDVSRIPLAAVERIEILPASAGAIYGANAVGGVVNIVLRREFSGAEISAYVGGAEHGGGEERNFSLFAGQSFNHGLTNVNVTVNHRVSGRLRMGDRDYLSRGLEATLANPVTSPFSNPSRFFATFMGPLATARATVRSASGLPIPGVTGATFAVVPAGATGLLTSASFSATAGQTGAGATGQYARKNLRIGREEWNVVVTGEHALFGDRLGLYTELTYRQSHADYSAPNRQPSSNILATNPFNPFGKTVMVFWDAVDLPDDTQFADKETVRGVVGLKGKFRAWENRTFNWAVDASSDYNTDLRYQKNSASGMFNALGQGIYNPFRDFNAVAPQAAAEAEKYFAESFQDVNSRIDALNLRLNGELFNAWGGPVRLSVVGERRRGATFSQSRVGAEGAYVTPSTPPAAGVWVKRYYTGGGGEVTVPLVGEHNSRPWLRAVDVSLGARYEEESNFGSATPGLAAIKVTLTPDVTLRAAYAGGYQPPTTNDLRQARFSQPRTGTSLALEDPLRPGQPMPAIITQVVGGNPDLQPEKSVSWDVGVVLTPRWVPGLTLNASYFRIEKENVIRSPGAQDFTTTANFFPELILRDPPSAADVAAGRPGPANTFINIAVNVAGVFTDGVDYRLKYDLPEFAWGRLRLDASYTWTKRFDSRITPVSAQSSSIDVLRGNGFPVVKQNKIRSTLEWTHGAWAASATGTYGNAYESNTTLASAYNPTGLGFDGPYVPSAFTLDAQVSYQVRPAASSGWRSWLGNTRWILGTLNVLDKSPAIVNSPGAGYYDVSMDPRRRFGYLSVRKIF